jgi:hypothetical protein
MLHFIYTINGVRKHRIPAPSTFYLLSKAFMASALVVA